MTDNPASDTFQPVGDGADLGGGCRITRLLMTTPTARIHLVTKAGKTMLLKTPADDSGRTLDLLKREYSLGIGLSHPGVASVYTWEAETPAGPGILMEYVDGRTLADYLREQPSAAARRRVFSQLLDAVGYIHSHGVTHNDLKPGNIMVSRANNDVKIIDFGLADNDSETVRRRLGGTAGYASPELSARDGGADMRSDIYSLGMIMRDIFGSRYSRIWRKCADADPRRRYPNTESLARAWRQRLRLPRVAAGVAAALILGAILVGGAVRMRDYRREVERYTMLSRQMADTITALRLEQAHAGDSMSRLTQRLSGIDKEKALADSLSGVYAAGATEVTERYKERFRQLRCKDETAYLYGLYEADMDRNDTVFLAQNPELGPAIRDKYWMSMRMQGALELEAIAATLPALVDLTPDARERARVLPLIQSGQPWGLRSDTVR